MTINDSLLVDEVNDLQIVNRINAPTIFIEGLSQIQFGYPNSYVVLHSRVMPKTPTSKERREVGVTLIMPTGALIDMAQTILGIARENQTQVAMANLAVKDSLEILFLKIPDTMTPGAMKPDPK